MVQTSPKTLALEEFLQLPETKPANEYINGQIIHKPMPSGEHSTLQRDLLFAIDAVTKPPKIARAFPELRCIFGERVLVPDIAVFTYAKIPRDQNGDIANLFTEAPDWTIEILSPDQSSTKVINKILHCLDHGTHMSWLIDPAERLILVHPAQQQPMSVSQETLEAIVPVSQFAQSVKLSVGKIFGWLSE